MDQSTFSFQNGQEAQHAAARWTRGKVQLRPKAFVLEAQLWRSAGPDFCSAHALDLEVEESFSAPCFVGILQLIGDRGFGASNGQLCTHEERQLSDEQARQVNDILVYWGLGLDCREAVPVTIADQLQARLRRVSIMERLGVACCTLPDG